MSISADQQSLRVMVDSIRKILGKDPLYSFNTKETMEERCHADEQSLPGPVEWKEWFKPKAIVTSTRSSFRDVSVTTALKRKALKFDADRERKRA